MGRMERAQQAAHYRQAGVPTDQATSTHLGAGPRASRRLGRHEVSRERDIFKVYLICRRSFIGLSGYSVVAASF